MQANDGGQHTMGDDKREEWEYYEDGGWMRVGTFSCDENGDDTGELLATVYDPAIGRQIVADHAAARDRRQLEERVREMEAALREIMDNTSPAAVEKASTQTVFLAIDIHQCAAEALLPPQESSGTEGEV